METNKLWNPTPEVQKALSKGNRKVRLAEIKREKSVKETACPYCGRAILMSSDQYGFEMFTYSGSRHACVASKVGRRS